MTERPEAGPAREDAPQAERPAGTRRRARQKSLRGAVERSLSRRTGTGAPTADGYGAVADSLVRQAVDGDLKAVKLLLEILESGGGPSDGEGVQVIVDV